MKLTWFAGTTIRIHIGGQIIVVDSGQAPASVDPRELQSGADRLLSLAIDDPGVTEVDAGAWRRRPAARFVDDAPAAPDVAVFRLAPGVLVFDAPGEAVLVLLAGAVPRFGRWANEAVIVLFGGAEAMVALGTVLLDIASPKLLALAADEATLDIAIAELAEHLDGTALVSLEPALALEA